MHKYLLILVILTSCGGPEILVEAIPDCNCSTFFCWDAKEKACVLWAEKNHLGCKVSCNE